jgi:hypothetical protein
MEQSKPPPEIVDELSTLRIQGHPLSKEEQKLLIDVLDGWLQKKRTDCRDRIKPNPQ